MNDTKHADQGKNRSGSGTDDLEEFYYNEGKKEGLIFVKPAGSAEILYVASNYQTAREKGVGPYDICNAEGEIGEYLQAVLHDINDPNLRCSDGVPTPMLAAWEQGWKDAVVEFYDEIKHKMFDPP